MSPQARNGSQALLWCVTVPGFTPGATVTLKRLDGYGTTDIFADATGCVYLWLPYGTHRFVANGTLYAAAVNAMDVTAVVMAEPDGLTITGIVLTDTAVKITVASDPADWMADGRETLCVRAGTTLPLSAGNEALLDQSQVSTTINADGTATISFPRPTTSPMFYRIEL